MTPHVTTVLHVFDHTTTQVTVEGPEVRVSFGNDVIAFAGDPADVRHTLLRGIAQLDEATR